MGGFHLKQEDKQTSETIKYLRNNEVQYVYPAHCTPLPALAAFYMNFGMDTVKTGQVLEL